MTDCLHKSLVVERKIIRANGRYKPGDENRVVAFWSAEDELMSRITRGEGIIIGRDGKAVPMAPRVAKAAPSDAFLNMGRDSQVLEQFLELQPGSRVKADDIGFMVAQGLKRWDGQVRHRGLANAPLAASVATLKGRDLETIALTASTSPTMYGTWGTNPATLTAAKTDVALFAERVGSESRTSVSPTQQTTTTVNDTWQYQFTLTSTGTVTIAEVGLFTASTQPAQATVAAGGVVGSGSSTTLNTAATFTPGNNNYIQIRTEFMQVTGGSGSQALTVVRMNNVAASLGGGTGNISTIAASDNVGVGNPPGQTGVTGGSLLIHADHTGDGLASGDSIQYTVKDQLS